MQSSGLFLILAMLILFWFVLMRPARNQQKRTQKLQRELAVGDEVVLSSGIFGTIRSLEDGRLQLEVAPGVEVTVARQAVVRQAEEHPEPADDTHDEPPEGPEGPVMGGDHPGETPGEQPGDQAGDQERY
jgi:preprotein translocase subunit YajC